jgi:hypothetical protein
MKAIKLQKHGVLKEYGVLVGNNNQLLRNEIKSGNSTNNLLLFNLINNSPTFINDVVISNEVIDKESIDITSITGHFDDSINTEYYAQFPLFFINKNIVKIPTKVEYVLRKYTPKKLLKEIHPNIDVAVELCLMFTSQLTSTYFERLDNPKKEGWKSLHAAYLREFLSLNSRTYKDVIKALEHTSSKGVIIECDYNRIIGKKNFYYRFGEAYAGKGIVSYHLQTKEAQRLLNKHFIRVSGKSQSNPIVQNLIQFYENISLPTIDQIWEEGYKLIKLKYMTKKGKLLKKLGKHSRSYFTNPQKYSFIENSIKVFKYLTEDGLIYPEIGNEKSGGRIVDSFTLMPSWIRQMLKVNGEAIMEADYSCLHPNIAVGLYGGIKEYLTHSDLGLAMSTDISIIKVEHLSFFNKKVWQMKASPLYKYYEKNEPKMLENVIEEKYASEFKHNITSRRLFAKEVEIMTKVVEELNKEFIYVGYVYDAFICHPNYANRVKEVMDSVILNKGIKTSAKLSNDNTESISSDVPNEKKYIKVNAGLINFNDGIRSRVLDEINNGTEVVFRDAIIEFNNKYTYYDKVLRIYDKINPELIYVIESHILNPLLY